MYQTRLRTIKNAMTSFACVVFAIVLTLATSQTLSAVAVRTPPAGGGPANCDKVVPDEHGMSISIVCQCEATTVVLAIHPFPFVDPQNPDNPPVTLGSRGRCSEIQRVPDATGAPSSTCSYHSDCDSIVPYGPNWNPRVWLPWWFTFVVVGHLDGP